MKSEKLVTRLASLLMAIENCEVSGNKEWHAKHMAEINRLVSLHMPRGAGFDNGTKLDFVASDSDKLVFHTEFHHMRESGMYDGWTVHKVTIRPSLVFGFNISSISGRDRDDIKSYIGEAFHSALSTIVDEEGKAVA